MVLLFVILALNFHAAPASAKARWKATDLARWAVEKNPSLQNNKLAWDLAKLDQKNRFYAFFPNLIFQTSAGFNAGTSAQPVDSAIPTTALPVLSTPTQTPFSDPWTSQYSLQLKDTLWSPDNNWWTYKEGSLNEQLTEVTYVQNRDQVLLSLVQNICTYLDLEFQLRIAREILKYVETEFSIIQSSYRQGLKSYSDFLRFKGQMLNQRIAVQNLETNVKKSLVDVAKVAEVHEDLGDVDDDMSGLGQSTDLIRTNDRLLIDQLLDYQRRLAEARVDVAKTRYPLRFDLSLGVGYSQQEILRSAEYLRAAGPLDSFGLFTVTWQLWDWGTSRRLIEITRLQQQQLVLEQQSSQTKDSSRFEQLSQDIRNFEDQQKSLNEIVKVESESLKQQTINYRNGKSTFLDYSTALTDLGNSKQSLRTSQLTLKKLRAEALSLKGRLYENLIAK